MDTNKPSSSSTFFLPFSLSPSLSIYAIVFPMPLLYLPFIMTINIRPNLLIWHQTTFISADSLACCSHQFRPCCIKICEPFLFYWESLQLKVCAGVIILSLSLSLISILIGKGAPGDTELGQKRALLVVYGVRTFIFLPPLTSRWTRSEDIFLQHVSLLHCLSNSAYLPLILTHRFKFVEVICAFSHLICINVFIFRQ